MKKLTIGFVSYVGCIRVLKEATVLQNLGHTVHHICAKEAYGWNKYDSFQLYADKESLIRSVKLIEGQCDIFHIHNEPDWIVSATREATDKPIVFDIHDLDSARHGETPREQETQAIKDSDAVIHTSKYMEQIFNETHNFFGPQAIVHPKVPSANLVPDQLAKNYCKDTIVYQGGISESPMMPTPSGKMIPNYRFYLDMVVGFTMCGYKPFIFSASHLEPRNVYQQSGAIVFPSIPWNDLLSALSAYQIGFVGAMQSNPLMEASSPNKLYEYISSGVVPVVMNAKHAGEVMRSYGNIGIEIDISGKTPIKDQVTSEIVEECHQNLLKVRKRIVMEDEAQIILNLYSHLL